MRVVLLAALLVAGLAASKAELELKTLQEDSQPGESSGTYAIVQDGRVVGMVKRYSASAAMAPLRRQMGRRAGPSDDYLPVHTSRLFDLVRARMDLVGALHDQVLASRCPFARQVALARLQAAAAENGLDPETRSALLPRPTHKMFGEPEYEYKRSAAPDNDVGAELDAGLVAEEGPHMPMPLLARHQRERVQEGDAEWALEDSVVEGTEFSEEPLDGEVGAAEGEEAVEYPYFPQPLVHRGGILPAPLPLLLTGPEPIPRPAVRRNVDDMAVPWQAIERTAMPAPELEPEVNWNLYNDDGSLNWGLLTFVTLAAACATVWGAMLAQYCLYCRARAQNSGRAFFITRVDSGTEGVMKPLLHEGHLNTSDSTAEGKEGVEYAAAHVPSTHQNVAVLQYSKN